MSINRFKLVPIIFLLFVSLTSHATHIIGGEISYTHISGNTYEIQVKLFGDCSGNSFPSLFDPSTIAQVNVLNGNNLYTTIDCIRFGNFGQEITPVCPADSNNTSCKNGNLPGIAEFKFKNTITLPSASANWRFAFAGSLGLNNGAGRTFAITNVNTSNGSVIYLIATLNNLNGNNSSPTLTTIPTPYFCINQNQQYNPGAFDADGDVLQFDLVDGLEVNAGNVTSVNYVGNYTGANPLAVLPNSFNFNSGNGQLNFNPNQNQIALVVNKISEFRNGVLVGTMMREMNFIVLNNCNNQSPTGSLDSTSAGSITAPTLIEICNADSLIEFAISSTDPDSQNVSVIPSGLPLGMTYVITGNNTPNPTIKFTWVLPATLIPNTVYNFFITFQDDGCPISSKQQIAYTIKVIDPISTQLLSTPESCNPGMDGQITIISTSTNSGNLQYELNAAGYGVSANFSNLSANQYTVNIKDAKGCTQQNIVNIDSAIKIKLGNEIIKDISCYGKTNGSISIQAIPNTVAVTFNLLPLNFQNTNGQFNNLTKGLYSVIGNSSFGCADTFSFEIKEPPPFVFTSIITEDDRCEKGIGTALVSANGGLGTVYSISPNQQLNTDGRFHHLSKGIYKIVAKDSNECVTDSILTINDWNNPLWLSFTKQDVSCIGNGNDGWAEVVANGGVSPYTYFWETNPKSNSARINDLRSGLKRVTVIDADGCSAVNYVIIDDANCCEKLFLPNAFSPNEDGKNDAFRINTPITMKINKFVVMDRWGKKVWSTVNQIDAWDGKYPNGKDADSGTYYYYLNYTCEGDGQTYIHKGDLVLLR